MESKNASSRTSGSTQTSKTTTRSGNASQTVQTTTIGHFTPKQIREKMIATRSRKYSPDEQVTALSIQFDEYIQNRNLGTLSTLSLDTLRKGFTEFARRIITKTVERQEGEFISVLVPAASIVTFPQALSFIGHSESEQVEADFCQIVDRDSCPTGMFYALEGVTLGETGETASFQKQFTDLDAAARPRFSGREITAIIVASQVATWGHVTQTEREELMSSHPEPTTFVAANSFWSQPRQALTVTSRGEIDEVSTSTQTNGSYQLPSCSRRSDGY